MLTASHTIRSSLIHLPSAHGEIICRGISDTDLVPLQPSAFSFNLCAISYETEKNDRSLPVSLITANVTADECVAAVIAK